jgi:hypothetical protein
MIKIENKKELLGHHKENKDNKHDNDTTSPLLIWFKNETPSKIRQD